MKIISNQPKSSYYKLFKDAFYVNNADASLKPVQHIYKSNLSQVLLLTSANSVLVSWFRLWATTKPFFLRPTLMGNKWLVRWLEKASRGSTMSSSGRRRVVLSALKAARY